MMNKLPKINHGQTQLSTLTAEQIEARVNGSNKFTKAEMMVCRKAVTLARKKKRERLAAMTAGDIGVSVTDLVDKGFVLTKQQPSKTKSGVEHVDFRLTKKPGASGAKAEAAKVKAENDKLRKALKAAGIDYDAVVNGGAVVEAETAVA